MEILENFYKNPGNVLAMVQEGEGDDKMARASKRKKEGQTSPAKCFRVGIYARLSVDGAAAFGQKGGVQNHKNESIDSQIALAKQYMKEHPEMELYGCYTDLGRTGTNFRREGFEQMMQDVRKKRINCVIVKDLSRFGRNHIETGNYIQKIFPFMGVRFIAIMDGMDTFAEKSSIDEMTVNLKNLVNEMYARDIAEKVRASRRSSQEQGSYTGGVPPYGYEAGWLEGKRCLFACSETAGIIRDIYDLFLSGENMRQIAKVLYGREIHRPAIYRKTGNIYRQQGEVLEQWGIGTIKNILANPVYMGCLAHRTTCGKQYKNGNCHRADGGYYIQYGTHEPIVSERIFSQVAVLLEKTEEKYSHTSVSVKKMMIEEDIYAGVLFCGGCGKRMVRVANRKQLRSGEMLCYYSYHCPACRRMDELQCQTESIGKRELERLVKIALYQQFALSGLCPDRLVEEGKMQAEEQAQVLRKKLIRCGKEWECGRGRGSELYLKYRTGSFSLEEFRQMKKEHEKSQQEIAEKKEGLLQELGYIEREMEKREKFLRSLMQCKKEVKLTKDVIGTLVRQIDVYADCRVKITFAFSMDRF